MAGQSAPQTTEAHQGSQTNDLKRSRDGAQFNFTDPLAQWPFRFHPGRTDRESLLGIKPSAPDRRFMSFRLTVEFRVDTAATVDSGFLSLED